MISDVFYGLISFIIFFIGITILTVNPFYSICLFIVSLYFMTKSFKIKVEIAHGASMLFIGCISLIIGVLFSWKIDIPLSFVLLITIFSLIILSEIRVYCSNEARFDAYIPHTIAVLGSLMGFVISVFVMLLILLLLMLLLVLISMMVKGDNKSFYPLPDKFGKSISDIDPEGYIRVFGEIWKAYSSGWRIRKGEYGYIEKFEEEYLRVQPAVVCPVCGRKYPLTETPNICVECGSDLSPLVLKKLEEAKKSS